jgi:hypothetical protein
VVSIILLTLIDYLKRKKIVHQKSSEKAITSLPVCGYLSKILLKLIGIREKRAAKNPRPPNFTFELF